MDHDLDAVDRFFAKAQLDPGSGCVLWMDGRFQNGYGRFKAKVGGKWKSLKAHRVSFMMLSGPIPSDRRVLHTCDVRACVNPDHLYLGTNQDNMDDMVSRGRSLSGPRHPKFGKSGMRGDAHPMRKLTDAQVVEVRRQLSDGVSQSEIARRFGVSQPCISSIHRGRHRKMF